MPFPIPNVVTAQHRYKSPPSHNAPSIKELEEKGYTFRPLNVKPEKASRCICVARFWTKEKWGTKRPLMFRYAVIDGLRWVGILDICPLCGRRKFSELKQTNEIFMWSYKYKKHKREKLKEAQNNAR